MRVIVGSNDLWPTPNVASAVLALMASIDDEYAVRCARDGTVASAVEELVIKIGERIPRRVHKFNAGSGTSYYRDAEMVDHSTAVYAFFAPGQLMQGGTGHVVAVALRQGKLVEAYELGTDGSVVQVASDEGDLLDMGNWTQYESTWT